MIILLTWIINGNFLCLPGFRPPSIATLPCSTPTTSLVLLPAAVIPAETGGCWALLLQSGIQCVSVLGSGIQGRLLFGRHSVRPPGVLSSYSNNRDVMDWWWRLLPFSPHSPQCSSVCVTDEQKLDAQMTRNVPFVWNVRAIWIPSSCSLPTCSLVRLCCCCTRVSQFYGSRLQSKSWKRAETFSGDYELMLKQELGENYERKIILARSQRVITKISMMLISQIAMDFTHAYLPHISKLKVW